MIPFLLWLLATLDAGFTGYREAAGRNALLDKRDYYRRAMIRGALFGQLAVLISGVLMLVAVWLSGEPHALIQDFHNFGARMLVVYVPYAVLILLAFALRAIPSVDLRSITSTVVFGPFTLIRPLVAAAGIAYGILARPRWVTAAIGLFVLLLMLSLGRIISWGRSGSFQSFGAQANPHLPPQST